MILIRLFFFSLIGIVLFTFTISWNHKIVSSHFTNSVIFSRKLLYMVFEITNFSQRNSNAANSHPDYIGWMVERSWRGFIRLEIISRVLLSFSDLVHYQSETNIKLNGNYSIASAFVRKSIYCNVRKNLVRISIKW